MLERSAWEEALAEAGFPAGGACPPRLPAGHGRLLEDWAARGFQAGMDWMIRTLPLRRDPALFHREARSVLAAGRPVPYGPHALEGGGRVARYALGRDYHKVLGKALASLEKALLRRGGTPAGPIRKALDLHPVAERALARQAGLGWIGRQGQLIHPRFGPWLLLGELFLPFELEPSRPLPERCGACRACMEACPTGAVAAPGLVDARRCLSYWTIEARGLPPRSLRPLLGDWFFGCDACLEACPWGRKAPRPDPAPPLHRAVTDLSLADYLGLTPERFQEVLRGTPLRRPGLEGLKRNAALCAANLGRLDLAPLLEDLLGDGSPLLRAAGAWALGRLKSGRGSLEKALAKEEDPAAAQEIRAALDEF